VALAAIAGCGGGGKEGGGGAKAKDPGAVVKEFAKAFGDADGAAACDLLTKPAQDAFVKRAQPLTGADDCPAAVERVAEAAGASVTGAYADSKVEDVKVTGSQATAQLNAGGAATTVTLVKEDGDWKLTKVPGL
jgi:hypothetical protein